MKNRIDLHMHSSFSDGTLSCLELIDEIKNKKINVFSITDHENIESIKKMKEIINKKDIEVDYIPGVEIAVSYLEKEYHLTCYGIDETNNDLIDLLENIRNIRYEFGEEIIKYLKNNKLVNIELDDFDDFIDNPSLGGWKTLNYLKYKGIVKDIVEYFELLSEFSFNLEFPDPKTVVDIVKNASGIVFLAHPSSNQAGGLSETVLNKFLEFGIQGLECYSPYCKSVEEIDYYKQFCIDNDIFISGGSDYHGKFVKRFLGVPEVYLKDISFSIFKPLIYKKERI